MTLLQTRLTVQDRGEIAHSRSSLRLCLFPVFIILLSAAFLASGCNDSHPSHAGDRDRSDRSATPANAGGGSRDTLLFSRITDEGCETSPGLVAFRQERLGPWLPYDQKGLEHCFACPLAFFPDPQGVGQLFIDGEPVPERPHDPEEAQNTLWWELKRGAPIHPLGEKVDTVTLMGNGTARKISVRQGALPFLPHMRILELKVRGARQGNRNPTLKVVCGDRVVFDEVIAHPKYDYYRIPFLQTEDLKFLEISAGLSEASIPIWADHSEEGEKQATVMIDEIHFTNVPALLLHMPEVKTDAKAEFHWAEFPARVYADEEKALMSEPGEALKARFLKQWAACGRKLGRTTMPALKVRTPASFAFPVEFGPKSRRLTFSVGLTPSFRNHVFVQVMAKPARKGAAPVQLLDDLVAQPLLEPEASWKSFSIELPGELSGNGSLIFRFSMEPASAEVPLPEKSIAPHAASPYAFALFSDPRLYPDREAVMAKPNAIVVSIDTLRADHLSCYGYPFATTPNIDAFAEDAIRFDHAISTSSWTLPAHLAMLNGVPLGQQGGLYKNRRIAPGIPTLATSLQNQGYATVAFVGGGYVSAEFGMNIGFDLFDERSLTISSGFRGVSAWLEKHGKDAPFFMLFHFFDVHSPYGDHASDPRVFFEASGCPYDEELVREIREGHYTHENTCGSFKLNISDLARQYMIHLYDADILEVDQWMAKLFTLLKELDLYDDTTIIVTADHGEEFGEHGNWHHSKHLYKEVVHVPMIMKPPAWNPIRPEEVEMPVSLLDIAPTLMGLAGAEPPEVWYGDSLLEIASSPGRFEDRRVLSENIIEHENRQVHMIALQDPKRKYFRVYCDEGEAYADGVRGFSGGERQELYRLESDPLERVDVSPAFPRMRDSLRKESIRITDRLKEIHSNAGGRGSGELSEDLVRQLQALGYM